VRPTAKTAAKAWADPTRGRAELSPDPLHPGIDPFGELIVVGIPNHRIHLIAHR
jgi:hypothetical protein